MLVLYFSVCRGIVVYLFCVCFYNCQCVCVCWLDADWEQLLTMELKEFSDGEMAIALTSVTTDKEVGCSSKNPLIACSLN